ncbi:MAG: queuosine precursor transporter [Spirochaetia bacterium]|nr:queuosine precursor transporter [Spirochaetia bacterium]
MLLYRFMGKTGIFLWIAIATILANIQVIKTTEILGYTFTLGNVLYGTTFLATDILSELYSEKDARKAVLIGFFALVTMMMTMNLALMVHPGANDLGHESLKRIFSIMPRITLGSLVAFIISQFHDVWAYNFWKKMLPEYKFIFIRNNASTLVSQLIDSIIFVTIAFGGLYRSEILIQIILTTYLMKGLVALLDTGFIYLAVHWFRNGKVREQR